MKLELEKAPLSEEYMRKAREELRETDTQAQKSLAELRELLKADKDIYYDDTDELLTIFLRPNKFYAKSAYQLMVRVAAFREKHADLLQGLAPRQEEANFLNNEVLNVLANRDQDGRRVLIFNIGSSWDPDKLDTDSIFRMLYLIHLAAIQEPITQVCGTVILMDFTSLGLKQVKAFSPNFSRKLLTFIQEAMPLRLKEIHIVFQPFIFKMVWSLFRPFIQEKLKKRIFFHGSNLQSLHKHLHPSILPEEYGGQKPKIDYGSKDWYPIMLQVEDEILKWNSYGNVKKA